MAATLLEALETLLRRPVSEQARQRATRHLMDWAGCAVAGSATLAGAAFRSAGDAGDIRILGQASGLTSRSAAFTMGAFGNPLEMDDLDRAAILHPGPVIMPAALAAAQVTQANPEAMLDGVVRGYDAMIRLGRTVGPGHYARYHNTATCGPFGAAVAVGSILELDCEPMLWAMGNALTQASGFWACRHEDVMTKQLHTARAAEAGLVAAMLARNGVTGPRHILEGPQGFYEGMCPDAKPDRLLAEPDHWCIHAVSFKPWPACRHCHPAIDAALMLRQQISSPEDIKSARIEVYRDAAIFCDKPDPQTTIDAKFSLQHAIATSLAVGAPDLAAFEANGRMRSDVIALRQRSSVIVDEALSNAYPAHFGAKVTLELWDGRELSDHRQDAVGDPELPMSDDQLIAKAKSLMAWGGLSTETARKLIDATLHLDKAPDLTPLLDALTGAVGIDQGKAL